MTYSVWGSFGTNTPTRDVFATETFAILKALTPPPSTLNVTIEVDGGVTKGDGLGGTFYYDPASVLADDAVDVIAPIPVPATGRWRRSVANIGFAVAVGGIIFGAAGNTFAQDPANLFWDNINKRLGIGIVPGKPLDILGPSNIGTVRIVRNDAGIAGNLILDLQNGSGGGTTVASVDSIGTARFGTSVVTLSIDSGTTGSLSLRTNNGATQIKIVNAGDGTNFASIQGGSSPFAPVVFSNGGDTNIGLVLGSKGTSPVDITTGGTFTGDVNSGRQLQARFMHTANTANYLNLTGGSTGQSPFIQSLGTDTNIGMRLIASGTGSIVFEAPGGTTQFTVLGTASANRNITAAGAVSPNNPILGTAGGGGVAIVGTTTSDSAATGQYGEYIDASVASGSAVALTTGVASNITNITLGAGDWDVSGTMAFLFGATTSYTNLIGAISTTTGALDAFIGGFFDYETPATVPTAGADQFWSLPTRRISVSTSTTIYLIAQGTFTISTLKAYGRIRARRMR